VRWSSNYSYYDWQFVTSFATEGEGPLYMLCVVWILTVQSQNKNIEVLMPLSSIHSTNSKYGPSINVLLRWRTEVGELTNA